MTAGDDTVLLSLLFKNEVCRGPLLKDFVEWCGKSYLCLNVTKTKDIDFKKYPPSRTNTVIYDNKAEVVNEYKYLGTTINNRLKWDRHCSVTYKKCQLCIYLSKKTSLF